MFQRNQRFYRLHFPFLEMCPTTFLFDPAGAAVVYGTWNRLGNFSPALPKIILVKPSAFRGASGPT